MAKSDSKNAGSVKYVFNEVYYSKEAYFNVVVVLLKKLGSRVYYSVNINDIR